MWIKIRMMTGGRECRLDGLSKLSTIEEVRRKIEATMEAKEEGELQPANQRLFFKGKELVDQHSLFDYDVGLDACIQLMLRKRVVKETNNNDDSSADANSEADGDAGVATKAVAEPKVEPDEINSEKVETDTDAASFKCGELVDVRDILTGAWFEAEVVEIKISTHAEQPTSSLSSSSSKSPPSYPNDGFVYVVKFEDYDTTETLTSTRLRPVARTKVAHTDLALDRYYMVNYNTDDPSLRGFWYDISVTGLSRRGSKELLGVLFAGADLVPLEVKIPVDVYGIFRLEDRDSSVRIFKDGRCGSPTPPPIRPTGPECDSCRGNAKRKCKKCGCSKCGGKDRPEKTIICDECEDGFHLWCLSPPLEEMPSEDEWFCPNCRNDASEIVRAGEGLKASKKKSSMPSAKGESKRDWGKGMSTQGVEKKCTIVDPDHFGAIPGVEVGTSWLYRLDVSSSGVHRPPVAGISGRAALGAVSVVLSGGYEDDEDNGDEFTYTGAGGRDLSGNKRTAAQSCDQKLEATNMALARNCNAPVSVKGGDAGADWRKGKPLRVVRNFRGSKHSKYAPESGNRYDGIYKVVQYWPEKGKAGFLVWRYRMRRDDPNPAPWTKAGKKRIVELGIEEMIVPPGYAEKEKEKERERERVKEEKKARKSGANDNEKENDKSQGKKGKKGRKRKISSSEDDDDDDADEDNKSKKARRETAACSGVVTFEPPSDVAARIVADSRNAKTWSAIDAERVKGRPKFVESMKTAFTCVCCQDVVVNPVTTSCAHNSCLLCLKRSFAAGVASCPVCRTELNEEIVKEINDDLKFILNALLPGYEFSRS